MKDRKSSRKPRASVDEFFRSVYDSLSVKVLAEQVASSPPTDEEIEAIEAAIDDLAAPAVTPPAAQKPASTASKKRARS